MNRDLPVPQLLALWRMRLWSAAAAVLFLLGCLLGSAAFAAVRPGWSEACIDGLQSYPASGVGTVAYCVAGYGSLEHAPDAASCSIWHAADYAGQSFACGPGTHLFHPADMAALPTGAPAGAASGAVTGVVTGNLVLSIDLPPAEELGTVWASGFIGVLTCYLFGWGTGTVLNFLKRK